MSTNAARFRRRHHLHWLCTTCDVSDAGCAIRYVVTSTPCCDTCEHIVERKTK